MITIQIYKEIPVVLPKNFKVDLSKFILQKLSVKKDICLSIHFISSSTIRSLNKKYRQIDLPTDILSFPLYKSISAISKCSQVQIELGDIFICPQIVINHEVEYRCAGMDKFIFIASHGIKHLLGIHHK
jgi:probable rRNA maturation factor